MTFAAQFVFLSYASENRQFALRLKADLETQGIYVWIDREGIAFGADDWETSIRNAVKASQAVLLLVSPDAHASKYVRAELRLAGFYERQVYPVLIEGTAWMDVVPVLGLAGAQYLDARTVPYEEFLQTLISELHTVLQKETHLPAKPSAPDAVPRNPYKGLKAFQQGDVGDFFGREGLIKELLKATEEAITPPRHRFQCAHFLAVIGPSGLGKSSVVLAGLLPRLHAGELQGSDKWVYLNTVWPGAHPTEELMLALKDALPDEGIEIIEAELAHKEARGLYRYASQLAKAPETKVVVIVDQFEELFTQTTSEDERQHFINLLVNAATEPRCPIMIVVTMRADFSDRPMLYPELSRLIEAHRTLVLPMELEDLREVIERPAALKGVQLVFEQNLVGDLLFDMNEQVGALPLLQFTLDQLFQLRADHQLTRDAYEKLGGIKGALSKHAEAAYAMLPSNTHRKLAHMLFLRLIDVGEQDVTRRRASLSEFALPDLKEEKLLRLTIEIFVLERLLTTNEIAGKTTIEVSHEALIREWPRLLLWANESRGDIRLQQTISKDADAWEQHHRATDRLYRGSQLKEARVWAERNISSTNEAAFLRASIGRRVRIAVTLITLFTLLLSSTGVAVWFAMHQSPNPTYVTNVQDSGTGSLRWAIANATDKSTITFAPELNRKTIRLTSDNLLIDKNLVIHGPDNGNIIISNVQEAPDQNIFKSGKYRSGNEIIIAAQVTVMIDHLNFQGGYSISDGAITNNGTLVISHCSISNNEVASGAIYNDGGHLVVDSCVIAHNSSSNGGGILNFNGTVTLSNSIVSFNHADVGGGIHNEGSFKLINSTISNNSSSINGGGIFNAYGNTFSIMKSTISANTSPDSGGGIFTSGGDIFNNLGSMSLSNSTVSESKGSDGIGILGGQLTITSSTIYRETAGQPEAEISIEDTLNNGIGKLEMKNSIVASDGDGKSASIVGNLATYGYNLIQNTSTIHFIDPLHKHKTDIVGSAFPLLNIDPVLRLNQGSTETHALLPGSPAIDKIPLDVCFVESIATDQRGVKRPQGTACDIGAYEYIPVQ
jgi:TIR domain